MTRVFRVAAIKPLRPKEAKEGFGSEPDERRQIRKKVYGHYQSGLHCAEVISKALLETFSGKAHPSVIKAASGFGGGIAGSTQELCGAFTGGGYQVDAELSSMEALRRFKEAPNRFDLVITDLTMPRMTGEKLAAEMMSVREDIPVILCSGYSERISARKAAAMGIRAYLLKPLNLRELAKTLRVVLDGT